MRAHARALAVAIALALVLPGCTVLEREDPPRPGSALRVATAHAIGSLDPVEASGAAATVVLANSMETLVRVADGGTLAPGLAESWRREGTTWTFTLREGVRFHDGAVLDAAAAKAAIDRARGHVAGRATNATSLLAAVLETRADGRALTVVLAAEDPDFAAVLAATETAIGSPRAYSPVAFRTGLRGDAPVGTGPFRVTAQAGGSVALAEFQDHWGPNARVETLTVNTVDDPLAAVEAGDADVAYGGVAPSAARDAEAAGEARLAWRPLPEVAVLRARGDGALASTAAREGIAYAIDRSALVARLAAANASPLATLPPAAGARAVEPGPDEAWTPPEWTLAPDLARARSLLDSAGATTSNPLRLTLAYAPSRSPDEDAAALALAAMLEGTGRVVVDVTAFDAVTVASGVERGLFDLAIDRVRAPAPSTTAWRDAFGPKPDGTLVPLWEERAPVALALNVTGVVGELDRVLLGTASRP